MNQRIRELMKQANRDIPLGKPFWSALEEFSEKFSELIVTECADIVEELAEKLAEQRPNSNYDSVAYECAEVIKTHFGVEL